MSEQLYIGLMSGTSMDSIDVALLRCREPRFDLIATCNRAWPDELRQRLRELASPGPNEIDRLGELDILVGEQFALAAQELLTQTGLEPTAITAIGSHGQTLRHRPTAQHPFTLQIGDPNRIAERTGITTVADFRRRDMAAGGEGAPLVPAFHAEVFRQAGECRVVLNLGGIANLTLLPREAAAPITGFDTGPGNCLMDSWAARHTKQRYDHDGAFAASGTICQTLLSGLLSDDYFQRPPPKSTGPEHFGMEWLMRHLARTPELSARDVQATLLALTVESIARALEATAPDSQRVLACGGGVHNTQLMRALDTRLQGRQVESTAQHGLDPDYVEAAAFAWLAHRTLNRKPGNLPAVTGANHPVILGGIYPA